MMDSLLKMKKTNKYPSLDQEHLRQIGDELCDNLEELLEYFDIEYRQTSKMMIFACPIHGGDNDTALNIYPYGDKYRGNWKCRTHQCESVFMSSIIGFVRGILSNREKGWKQSGDQTVSFNETLKFIEQFLKKDLSELPKKSRISNDKNKFIQNIKTLLKQPEKQKTIITRDTIRRSLQIPAKYYINRGYSKEILDKYDIGLCSSPGKPMHNRVVVPIYDNDHKYMIGCSGRSIFEKCNNCNYYHDQGNRCPTDYKWSFSKWKHNSGFKAEDTLYNYWFAKQYIQETKTAIIVESPGNVWKLEDNNIHNSVAIFGSNISNKQKLLLDISGAMNIVILTDNDPAGEKAKQQIIKKFSQTYRIFCPLITKNDVGDLTSEEIKTQITNYLQENKI